MECRTIKSAVGIVETLRRTADLAPRQMREIATEVATHHKSQVNTVTRPARRTRVDETPAAVTTEKQLNVSLMPNVAAKGIPTWVPGPPPRPRARRGTEPMTAVVTGYGSNVVLDKAQLRARSVHGNGQGARARQRRCCWILDEKFKTCDERHHRPTVHGIDGRLTPQIGCR